MQLTEPDRAGVLRRHLDAVKWAELSDANGPAHGIPGLVLDALADDESAARDAVSQLHHRVFHQGVLEETAPLVVPPLLELLRIPGVRIKAFVLSVLASLVTDAARLAGRPGLPPAGLPAAPSPGAEAQAPEQDLYALVQQTWGAVQQGQNTVATLLQDGDASVRVQAGRLLALVADRDDETCKRLLQQACIGETDHLVRGSQLIALSVLQHDERDDSVLELCRRTLAEPVLQGVAAVAWVYAGGHALDDAVRRGLTYAGRHERLPPDLFPWMDGGLASLAAEAWGRLASNARPQVIEGLLDSLRFQLTEGNERGDDIPFDWTLPAAVAERLVGLVFNGATRGRDLLREELGAEQLRVLEEFSRLDFYAPSLYDVGIPHCSANLRRFLGIDPQGPQDLYLELPADGCIERRPFWYWRRLAYQEKLPQGSLVSAVLSQWPPELVFRLSVDVATGAYDPSAMAPGRVVPLAMELVEAVRDKIPELIEQHASLLLREPVRPLSQVALVVVPLLERCLEDGRQLEESYGHLIAEALAAGGRLRELVLRLMPSAAT